MLTLSVALEERSYPIFVGRNVIEQAELWLPYIRSHQVLIVTNATIAPLYLDRVKAQLAANRGIYLR